MTSTATANRQEAKTPSTPWRLGVLAVNAFLVGCASPPDLKIPKPNDSQYLYVWTAGADSTAQDFLAVYDVRPDSGGYGALVATVPVGSGGNGPHHTEHQLAPDRQFFVNGFGTGQSWIFDLADPAAPKIVGNFGDQSGFSHPHAFVRLPNGNVLATFQMRHDSSGMHPGGLVEMTPKGQVVRAASAIAPGVPDGLRPYSAAVVPAIDRIVTTTTDMDEKNPYVATELQVWKLSTLELLHTFALPPGPAGDENQYTSEPRLLSDGRTVMVGTFNCGLFLLDSLESETPSGQFVASFPRKPDTYCAIPVVSGHHWLVTVPSISGVVSLDISNPLAPREVSRVTLDSTDIPHWISLEPNGRRLVITGYGTLRNRLLLATFDSTTGALALDSLFRPAPGARPGFDVAGVPHGAVFSRP